MSFTGAEYQEADFLVVSGWLDATLEATLSALYTWRGFIGPFDEVGTALSTATIGTAFPAAGLLYDLRYVTTPRALSENMLLRQGILDLTIRTQPSERAGALESIFAAARSIKERISVLSLPESFGDISKPLLPLGVREMWPEFRMLIPVWLE